MNQAASILWGFASKTGREGSFWRVVFGTLVLVLAAGSAGPVPAAPVDAAPPATVFVTKQFHLDVFPLSTLCVGQVQDYGVSMGVDVSGTAGNTNYNTQDQLVPGIVIKAQMLDTSIATVAPAQKTTTGQPVSEASWNDVSFVLHPKKVGSTSLTLKATVPAQLAGSASTVSRDIPFKVENCKYRITVHGAWAAQYPNLVSRLSESLQGEVVRNDFGDWVGTANVAWSLRSYSVMCPHAHGITLGKASLTAQADESYIHITVIPDPFELVTVNCGSGTHGEIPAPTLVAGSTNEGSTTSWDSSFPVGKELLNGSVTITIRPVPIQ